MKKGQVNIKTIAFMLGLLLISCLVIFKDFIFGDKILAYTDIGSDTYDQYLFHYQAIINHIREGNFSLWDFNNGYGVNMYTYNLFNPSIWLIYLVGIVFGAEQIYGFMVYWMILHILMACISIYLFLSCFSLSEPAKVLASYAYALCGYLVVWGQHYHFAFVIFLLPLLLASVEWCMEKARWYITITLLCAVASMCSLYMAYMQFIVLGFYILFRVSWESSLVSRAGIKKVGSMYGFMLLGIGIGMIQLLPSAYQILNVSGRVGGSSFFQKIISMLTLYPSEYYEVLVKRFLSSNFLGVDEYMGYMNFYEDPNVFLSALLPIGLVQMVYFFFKGNYNKKQKWLLLLAVAAFGFVLLIPLGSAIFNAFAYPFCRHTFICMPFGAWVIAFVLHKILEEKKCNIPLLIISVIGIFGCYTMVFLGTGKKVPFLLGVLALGMGISILLYLISQKREIAKLCSVLLLGCLVLTMSGDAYLAYSKYRTTLVKEGSDYLDNLYDEDVSAALSYLEQNDDSFYRVEKDYNVGINVSCLNSMAQNYRGISTYNSILNTNIAEWMTNVWPNSFIVNASHYSFANAGNEDLPASLSNIKYVLSKNGNYSAPGYVLLEQFGDIYLYENTNTDGIAKFYTKTISSADYNNENSLLKEYLICDTLPEYQVSAEQTVISEKRQISDNEKIYIDQSNDGVICIMADQINREENKKYIIEYDISYGLGSNYVSIISGGISTFTYLTPVSTHMTMTLPSEDDQIQFLCSAGMDTENLHIANICVYESEMDDLSELSEGIFIENPANDSVVKGTARVDEDGVLMMAIPYEDGWHAYVDGEETDIHKVDFGFCGIELEPGNHEIEMHFECPGFMEGAVVSGCFLILTIGIWWIVPKYQKKNIKELKVSR